MNELAIDIIAQAVLLLYPAWRIYGKAGLNPVTSLTLLIPYLGVPICALILVISKWNVQPIGGN